MTFTCRFGIWLAVILASASPLSAQKPADPTHPLISPPSATEPSILCGMTIFSGKPALDPKMPKSPPPGNFTMRVQTPTICRAISWLSPLKDLKDLPNKLPTFLGPRR
jgi:hypothetical protein